MKKDIRASAFFQFSSHRNSARLKSPSRIYFACRFEARTVQSQDFEYRLLKSPARKMSGTTFALPSELHIREGTEALRRSSQNSRPGKGKEQEFEASSSSRLTSRFVEIRLVFLFSCRLSDLSCFARDCFWGQKSLPRHWPPTSRTPTFAFPCLPPRHFPPSCAHKDLRRAAFEFVKSFAARINNEYPFSAPRQIEITTRAREMSITLVMYKECVRRRAATSPELPASHLQTQQTLNLSLSTTQKRQKSETTLDACNESPDWNLEWKARAKSLHQQHM